MYIVLNRLTSDGKLDYNARDIAVSLGLGGLAIHLKQTVLSLGQIMGLATSSPDQKLVCIGC